jgi:transcriptional regulator with XRE-family HTH domain
MRVNPRGLGVLEDRSVTSAQDRSPAGSRLRRLLRLLQVPEEAGEGHGPRWRRYTGTEIATALVTERPDLGEVTDVREALGVILAGRSEDADDELLQALSTFFDVPPEYFLDDQTADGIEAELLDTLLREMGAGPVMFCRTYLTPAAANDALLVVLDVLREQAPEPPEAGPADR